MDYKKRVLIIILATLSLLIQNAFADIIAKEETTPPPAEGALTANQIPPITKIGKKLPVPAAPATTPTTTNTQILLPAGPSNQTIQPSPPAGLQQPNVSPPATLQ